MNTSPDAAPARPTTRLGGLLAAWLNLWPSVRLGTWLSLIGVLYWMTAVQFDAGRPDFYYLADAFLNGHTWLQHPVAALDSIVIGDHAYVPFAPLPAIILAPLVALLGIAAAADLQPVTNAVLGVAALGLTWRLSERLGVEDHRQRSWLVILTGLGTPLWWVVQRGGVWHQGQLVATILTLLALNEAFGRRRAGVLGILAGLSFLARPTLIAGVPYWAWRSGVTATQATGRTIARAIALVSTGAAAGVLVALWYNAVRFGQPLESGYGLAVLPAFLEAQRRQGLFSLSHVPMNVDYWLLHLPRLNADFPWLRGDGFGLSAFIASPGLLSALRVRLGRDALALALTAALVMIPNLLYYGGGWYQFSFRYALDAYPFVIALCALAVARRGLGWRWRAVITLGVLVNLSGVYWGYLANGS
jgi:hypothetical protein